MKRKLSIIPVLLLLAGTAYAQTGELWLFSGQSNMELPIRRCMDVVADDVKDYSCDQLHYLKVPLTYNFDGPQKELPGGKWETLTTPQTAQEWGALCYYVGRYLHERTGKEISLLNSSVGGSPIEAWIPESFLPDYALAELKQCQDPEWMAKTLYHNAHLYSDWQDTHNALPENKSARWEDIDMFGNWGYEDGHAVFGSHYLRNSFRLSAAQCKGDAILHLGAMRDADSTFVNGHYVGNTTYMYPPRNYKVPAEYLKKGENVVEIHLYAAESGAGFVPDKEYSLETVKGKASLDSGWQHKAGRKMPRRDAQVFLQYKAAGLYNAMIAPLQGMDFKGVVWYQGESNAGNPDNYGELLKTMIRSWRVLLRNEKLPFYIVELASFEHSERETAETSGWVKLQDIQRQVCEEMENVYLIPNRDLGEWNDIHPQDKKTLGARATDIILNSR